MDFLSRLFLRLIADNKKRKRWRVFTTALAGIVVFATTYGLILPAITVAVEEADEIPGIYLEDAAGDDAFLEEDVWEDEVYDEFDGIPMEDDSYWEEGGDDAAFESGNDAGSAGWDDAVFEDGNGADFEGRDDAVFEDGNGTDFEGRDDVVFEDEEEVDGGEFEAEPEASAGIPAVDGFQDDGGNSITELETDTDGGVHVRLSFDSSAMIPEGTELSVHEIDASDEAERPVYQELRDASDEAVSLDFTGWAISDARFFRLELLCDGVEVDTYAGFSSGSSVSVEFQFSNQLYGESLKVIHFEKEALEGGNGGALLPLLVDDVACEGNGGAGVSRVIFEAEYVAAFGFLMGSVVTEGAVEAVVEGSAAEENGEPEAAESVVEGIVAEEGGEPEAAVESAVERIAAEESGEPEAAVESVVEEVAELESTVESVVEEAAEPESMVESVVEEVAEPESTAESAVEEVAEPESTVESVVEEIAEPESNAESVVEDVAEIDSADYPAQEFHAEAGGVTVHVYAEAGTFPEGTVMDVRAVDDEDTISAISEAAEEDESIIKKIHAVEITFHDAAGREIEPRKPVRVEMVSDEVGENEKAVVVHVDDDGNAETLDGVEVVSRDAGAYAEVTDGASNVEMADDATEASDAEAASGAAGASGFEAANDTADGATAAQDVETTNEASDSADVETEAGVGAVVFTEEEQGLSDEGTEAIVFEADEFSIYAIVYTVDFHWEVNGKMYEFSLPGGGFVSFTDLVEVLGIAISDNNTTNVAENDADITENASENDVQLAGEVSGVENQDTTALTLDGIEISDETRKFVEDVEKVEFSSPELVWVGKVVSETTVGQLKDENKLEVEYSAELTEEQIDQINDTSVSGGDWALISLKAFDTEESLAVTMKTGEVFMVRVTDARDPLGLDGRTFSIVNQRDGNWYALRAEENKNQLKTRGYYLFADSVSHTIKNNTEYSGVEADAWKFEYNAEADAYYVSANGLYLYIDPTIEKKEDTNQGAKSRALNLVSNKDQADKGTLIKISKDEDGNYIFKSNSEKITLWNYGSSQYWLDNGTGNEGKMRLCLPEDSGDNASHKASLISAADTQPGQKIVVYQRVWTTGSDGQPEVNYYAIDGNGNLVKVTNSSDAVYWKGNQSVEWTLTDLGNGYYTLYNETTGKYLTPKSDGIVHTADDAAFAGDSKHLSISLPGRDEGSYTSRIASWDYNANVTYGMSTDGASTSTLELLESQNFYFAARDPIVNDQLTTVDTVNSKDKGIKITMYDWGNVYGTDSHRENWDQVSTNPGLQAYLDFQRNLMGTSSHDYKSGMVQTDILARTIEEGKSFPEILTNSGHYLGELFADDYIKGGSGNKDKFNNLFLQSVYDETGFYKYSCFENYAYLPDGSTDFTVYEQIGTPSNRYVNDSQDWTATNANFMRGNFTPYNAINTAMEYRSNEYDPDLHKLPNSDPRKGERLYYIENLSTESGQTASSNPETYANYFFGMKMEATFTQNPGGLAENGDPMVYEFNGDDDLWVYIDNVLVLDLGGVHDAFRGKIDFRTGKVTCNAKNGQNTYIKQMFKEAGKFPDGTNWDDSKVDDYFTNGGTDENGKLIGTFKDNSTHDFKMFYMERGASASNLEMQFNLPVLTGSEFRVKKEMPETKSGQVIQSKYANAAFYYEAYIEENGSFQKVTKDYFSQHGLAQPVYDDGNPVVWKEGSDTIFEIKPGDTANFPMSSDSIKWFVVEVEPEAGSHMLDNYAVSNSDQVLTERTLADGTTVTDGTESAKRTIKNRNIVTYQNRPDDKLVNELQIKKKINGTAYHDNDAFEYRIFLETTDGDLVAYNLGEYYQTDSQGRYVYYQNGNRLFQSENPNGPYTYVLNGETITNSSTPRYAEHTSANGSLGDIRDGDTIIIKGLLEGTDFYVYERTDYDYMTKDGKTVADKYTFDGTEVTDAYTRNPETNKPNYPVGTLYDPPTMDGVEKYNPSDYEEAQAATGTIIQNKDAKVLVKNKPYSPDLTIKVEKQWSGIEGTDLALSNSSVKVTLGRYKVTDKAGNFTIQKTIEVVPGNAGDPSLNVKYTITGQDAGGNNRTYEYTLSGSGTVSGSIAPGSYTVTETVVSADGSYTWDHGTQSKPLTVEDKGNGTPNPVTFESKATVKTGTLIIKSSLNNGGSSVSFNDVKYTVYESNGTTRAKYPNGTEIPEVSFDKASKNGGEVLTGLKVGTYIVKESTLPTVEGYEVTEHKPLNDDKISVEVKESPYQAQAEFSTKYEIAESNSTYKFKQPDGWGGNTLVNGDIKLSGGKGVAPGTNILLKFKTKDGWDRRYDSQNVWEAKYNNTVISKDNFTANVIDGHCEYSAPITVVKDAELVIVLSANSGDIYDVEFAKVTGPNGAPRRPTPASAPRKAIKAGTETVTPDSSSYGEEPTDLLKNYVDDTTFSKEVTLNQSGEWKWQEELPATDDQGNKYYYYIKEVVETNMPKGTTCTVQLDGDKKYLVGDGVHIDGDGNPLPLIVANTVVEQPETGSLSITKAVKINGSAPADVAAALKNKADGTYTFKIYNSDGTTEVTKKADGTDIGELSITVTDGVASGSITIDGLTPGTYVIKETEPTNTKISVDSTVTGYDSAKGGIVVTVSAGDTGGVPVAAFTNKYSETEITVKKTDSTKTGSDRFIAGAKFSLLDSEEHSVTGYKVIDLSTNEELTLVDNKFTIPVEGVKITGLANGSYVLKEWEAPAGYIITNSNTTFTVADGQVTSGNSGLTFEIQNPPGAALPSTGGPGTTFLTILGSILVMLSGIGLILWRRRRFMV